jgi:hypothetical protein
MFIRDSIQPDGSIDWGASARTVVYDTTSVAQGLTQLHCHRDGLVYTDAAHTSRFDTSALSTWFSGPGWGIYVMSETGNIHASEHSVGHRHHTSLLAAASVAGAGEVKALKGKLVDISSKSGHYAPTAVHLLQVLFLLDKRGADLRATRVTLKTAAHSQTFAGVNAFISFLKAGGFETDFEFAKMMAYLNSIPYLQFVPLAAAQGWRWGTPEDFAPGEPAAGGRGLVRISDGSQVPHRDVRRWLKSLGHVLPTTVQKGTHR